MAKLRVLNHTGDTTLEWDVKKPASVEVVKAQFDEIIRQGYMAFRVDSPSSGEVIRSFDPAAKEIIMTAPLVGG
jgi:hypothetical protein